TERMPTGVATSTDPVIAKRVPQSMGVRLYRPSAGFQDRSVTNGSKPTCRNTGSDSATRNTTISTTMIPAAAAQPRSSQTTTRSLSHRDKALLPNQVVDLLRTGEVDELLDQSFRWGLRDQVERPRQRKRAVGDVGRRRRDPADGQQLDGDPLR